MKHCDTRDVCNISTLNKQNLRKGSYHSVYIGWNRKVADSEKQEKE